MSTGNTRWITVAEFESDVVNAETNVDWLLIRATKRMVTQYMIEHKHLQVSTGVTALTLEDVILPLYDCRCDTLPPANAFPLCFC